MKRSVLFCFLAVLTAFALSCGGPATNTSTNTNANSNASKPIAAAPTKEALLDMDKKANEAYFKGDSAYFEGFLGDKFAMSEHGQRKDKAAVVKMIGGVKCDMKTWSLDDSQMAEINADTYVLTYKGTFDGNCTFDGKTEKAPSPIRSASVYARNGDKWVAVFHGENMIIDPKAPPSSDKKDEMKGDAMKKDDGMKKDDAMKKDDGMKKDDKMASNSNTAEAKPATGDANTEALIKLHTSGWEAFKAKDAKAFDTILSANMSNIDPLGGWLSGKAAIIKQWTETMKCEGITKVAVTDGFASAISPTVEVLTLKGNADGTCDGQKNGDLHQTAFYVKEGDVWKLAFMFESAGM